MSQFEGGLHTDQLQSPVSSKHGPIHELDSSNESTLAAVQSADIAHKCYAMQLGDFLGPKVDKAGGMMAMADVYCLFNRARGSELVSPDDLLQACSCFSQAGVPLSLKQFSTGALVVQSRSHSTGQVSVSAQPSPWEAWVVAVKKKKDFWGGVAVWGGRMLAQALHHSRVGVALCYMVSCLLVRQHACCSVGLGVCELLLLARGLWRASLEYICLCDVVGDGMAVGP